MRGVKRETAVDLDELVDYVVRVFDNVLTRSGVSGADDNSGEAGVRLFGEHREDSYLMSIDTIRQNSFGEKDAFTYVMVRGPVQVMLRTEGSGPEQSITLTEQGEVIRRGSYEILFSHGFGDGDLFYMERQGDVSVLAIPHDLDYYVEWEATGDGTVQILQATCGVRASAKYPGAISEPFRVHKSDKGTAFVREGGTARLPEGFTEKTFDAEELASFLGIASVGLNWRAALVIVNLLIGLCAALIFCLVLRHMSRGRRYGWLVWLCFVLYCILVVQTEAAYWFFADRPVFEVIWKVLAGAVLAVLFFRQKPSGERLIFSALPGLTFILVGDIIAVFAFEAGGVLFLLGHVLLALCFLKRTPIAGRKWVQWLLLSVALVAFIVWRIVPGEGAEAWWSAVAAPVVLLLGYSGMSQSPRARNCARLLVAAAEKN